MGLSGIAAADVVMDQIGDMDGSGIADNIMASQDFEASFDVYDVVVADNFSGDGCNATCSSNETCGNGVVDVVTGEQCDDGNVAAGDGCGSTCSIETCGNGIVDPGEICDDGNNISGDNCSADCASDESCGNGTVDVSVGEVCDDGNSVDGDTCASDCSNACPAGHIYGGTGNCYVGLAGPFDWPDAVAACLGVGGYPATAADAGENAHINAEISGDKLIGLTDLAVEGTFEWITGEPLAYVNWAAGEPDNNSGVQHCLRMASSGIWTDDECYAETNRRFKVVCEIEP